MSTNDETEIEKRTYAVSAHFQVLHPLTDSQVADLKAAGDSMKRMTPNESALHLYAWRGDVTSIDLIVAIDETRHIVESVVQGEVDFTYLQADESYASIKAALLR